MSLLDENDEEENVIPKKTYKLRSPMLDSAIYGDENGSSGGGYGFLTFTSYVFWAFTLIFFIAGCKALLDNYTVDLVAGLYHGSIAFALALLCLLFPSIVKLFVTIEQYLAQIARELKPNKDED